MYMYERSYAVFWLRDHYVLTSPKYLKYYYTCHVLSVRGRRALPPLLRAMHELGGVKGEGEGEGEVEGEGQGEGG